MLLLSAAVLSSCTTSLSGALPTNGPVYPDRTHPPGSGSAFASVRANANCGEGWDGCYGKALGARTGTACAKQILWLAQWGDMSVETAARNGGISVLLATDYSYTSYLFIVFEERCVIAHGN